jgi:hypothetical protein
MTNIVLEPSHPMASSNTGDSRLFRNSVGNYISRKAYLELLSLKRVAYLIDTLALMSPLGLWV